MKETAMAKRPPANSLTCTLAVTLTNDKGRRPSQGQMAHASEVLREAIQNRLFGEGFLPDDLLVDSYDITID
jgi:hypothetical protein